jgi:hypothetical protein
VIIFRLADKTPGSVNAALDTVHPTVPRPP